MASSDQPPPPQQQHDLTPSGSARDDLRRAYFQNIIPLQEYLLQGSIFDNSVEHLLHRLKGLCDDPETTPFPFDDYEGCFSLHAGPPAQPLQMRVRKSAAMPKDPDELAFLLRYCGQLEIGDHTRPTLVRNVLDVHVTKNVIEFLLALGCRVDFEYQIRGYMYLKGRMKITVGKVFKLATRRRCVGEAIAIESFTRSYLVEMSVLAPNGEEAVGHEMRAFAEQLKPLVQMEKRDFKWMGGFPGQ